MAALGRVARAEDIVRAGRASALAQVDPELARVVAMAALDAARSAGASFADVRVDAEVSQSIGVWQGRASGPVRYGDRFTYGVRVLVDGQWGFAGDQDPSPDIVSRCAQRAVAQARAMARDQRPPQVLAPAPVIRNGTWATRVEVDPFAVPVGEQQDVLARAIAAGRGVRGVTDAGGELAFQRTMRTFASSEGSVISQTVVVAAPGLSTYATAQSDASYTVGRRVWAFGPTQRGYEVVRDVDLQRGVVEAAESAVRASVVRPVTVGRYDVVVSASVMASLVSALSGGAPVGVLGRSIAAPVLHVTADRSLSHGLATVGWDDEGVAPSEFPMVESGVLVDRPTTRTGAVALASWYATRAPGRVVGSHGCAMADGLSTPHSGMPNLAIAPGGEALGVRDLIAGVRRGMYLSEDAGGGQVPGGIEQWSASAVQEIRDGKLVGYVRDAAIQFRALEFWHALDAIGGPASVEAVAMGGATVRSVPGRFRRVNVVSTGVMG
jgi:TldD protein